MGETERKCTPDYRFILANERTYLSYSRTALGLLLAGATLLHLDDFLGNRVTTQTVGAILMLVGVITSVGGFLRWRSNEHHIHADEPLDRTHIPHYITVAITVIAVVVIVLSLT